MKKVLINCENRELRVAILEDDQLTELYIESIDNKSILNNIYKGRVEGVIPGLKAAFVNIGLERNAFLHFDDIRRELLLPKGQEPSAARPELEQAQPVEASAEAAPSAEPVTEYQPSDEELEVVAELTAPDADRVPEVALPGGDKAGGDDFDRNRRRRGRRGGKHRHPDDQGARPGDGQQQDRPSYGDQRQPGQGGGQSADGGRQPSGQDNAFNKKRKRRRKKGRGDRQPQPQQQQSREPGQNWVPPQPTWTPGAPAGSRAASNPYDVFSPYYQQPPANKKQRRVWKAPQMPQHPLPGQNANIDPGRDSQEHFFGPVRRQSADAPPEQHVEEEEFDGPAPGNELVPRPQQARPARNQGKRRTIRRRGPSYFAVRKKASDEPEADKPKPSAKAKAVPKAPAKARTRTAATDDKPASKTRARKTAKADEGDGLIAALTGKARPAKVEQPKTVKVAKPEVVKVVKALKTKPAPATAAETSEKKPRATRKKAEPAAPVTTAGAETAPKPARTRRKKSEPESVPSQQVAAKPESAQSPSAARVAEPPAAPVAEPQSTGQPAAPPQGEAGTLPARKPRRRGGRGRGGRGGRQQSGTGRVELGAGAPAEGAEPPAATAAVAPSPESPAEAVQAPAVESPTSTEVAPPTEGQPGADQPVGDQQAARLGRREFFKRQREQRRTEREARRAKRDGGQQIQPPQQAAQAQQSQQQVQPYVRPLSPTEALKKGDEIMVQVIKEEIGLKGARISTYVSMPGRYLVFLPYSNDSGGVSRKVEDFEERKRLKHLLRDIHSELAGDQNAGFIIRTAGVDRSEEEIRADAQFLTSEWSKIADRYDGTRVTEAVHDDSDILRRLARDVFDDSIEEIVIDSDKMADKLKETLGTLIPELVDRVTVYSDSENLFSRYGVEKQIQKAARRKVWLKSGGYLIIDEAEALTAIDVNTGKFVGKDDQEKMILKTNLEASKAIARELRLRDIGGLIVIDFIDMRDWRNREQVLNEFKGYLKKDRSKTSVSSISEFGLVEMTRKRVRRSLRKTIFMDCPYCQGSGAILNEQQIWMHIKNDMVQVLEDTQPPPSLSVVVNPRIRAYLDQSCREAIAEVSNKYGIEIRLGMSDVFHVENYAIEKITRNGERVPAAGESN